MSHEHNSQLLAEFRALQDKIREEREIMVPQLPILVEDVDYLSFSCADEKSDHKGDIVIPRGIGALAEDK